MRQLLCVFVLMRDVRSRTVHAFERHRVVRLDDLREEIIADQFDLLQKTENLRVQSLPIELIRFAYDKTAVAFLNGCRCAFVNNARLRSLSIHFSRTEALQVATHVRLDTNGCELLSKVFPVLFVVGNGLKQRRTITMGSKQRTERRTRENFGCR